MTVTIEGRECAQGVDVSRWQGGINYDAFNLDFAYIKATGGDAGLYTDPQFVANSRWPTPWGPYHFASMGLDPTTEADFFCDVILRSAWAKLPPERQLPPALDWEPTKALPNSGAVVLTMLNRIEARTGRRPILYTGAYVALDRVPALLKYDLWLAAYTGHSISCPPWPSWSLWQHTSSGHAGGVNGGVDSDYADTAWLTRVLGTQPAPAPTPQPPEDDDMAPPLYRYADGTLFALVPTDDTISTNGFAWRAFTDPAVVTRVRHAGCVDPSRVVQLQVEGSADDDRFFESFAILNPPELRRPAAGG